MQCEQVILINGTKINLCYEEQHSSDINKPNGMLSVLQYRKDGKYTPNASETYDRYAPGIAKKFSEEISNTFPCIDLVTSPPSESKQYELFVDAFRDTIPVTFLDEPITKPKGLRAGENIPYDKLLNSFTIKDDAFTDMQDEYKVCCIVDDIYGTGNTVAATIEKLHTKLPSLEEFVIACPLRIDQSSTLPRP